MFGQGRKSGRGIETLVGAGTRVEGNLVANGGLHLEGEVRGNVSVAPGAQAILSIAAGGRIEGNVDVPRVVVHGEVCGNILATDRVELGPTARVSGDVTYGVIEMAAGAIIQGRLVAARPASSS